MTNTDSDRRAFLRSLKLKLVDIQEAAASSMPIHPTEAELDADIKAARAEYRTQKKRDK